jgi:hypothetical protein
MLELKNKIDSIYYSLPLSLPHYQDGGVERLHVKIFDKLGTVACSVN